MKYNIIPHTCKMLANSSVKSRPSREPPDRVRSILVFMANSARADTVPAVAPTAISTCSFWTV